MAETLGCVHEFLFIFLQVIPSKRNRNRHFGYDVEAFSNENLRCTLQEDCPLASLPLLGYSITTPSEKDAIQKEFVFKLQFKNHVYFFRAESEYTFNRWVSEYSSALFREIFSTLYNSTGGWK